MLYCRIVGVQLFKLGEQYLHILQLPAFFPVVDQQHPRLAIGRMALDDFLQLLLRRFQFFCAVKSGGEVVAVIFVVRLQLHRFGQTEQGVFALAMVQQPQPQGMLQIGGVRLGFKLLREQLSRGVGLPLAVEHIIQDAGTPGIEDFAREIGADFYRVVKQVGNYGEVYNRNVGEGSPLKIERGLNRLQRDGGLMIPLPFN